MKKILNLSIFCSFLALASCKKNELKSDLASQSASNKTNAIVDNLYGQVGYGYDVTGIYASINSARLKIIDIAKLEKDYPNRVNVYPGVEQYTKITAGANSRDFTTNLTTNFTGALDFKLFGGSVKSTFKDSNKVSNKYSYATISNIIKQRIVTLNAPEDLIISSYLTEEFKADVNRMTPQQLVAAYGTHTLTNIVLGAKLELNYRSTTNSSDKKTAVTAGAVANGLVKFFSTTVDITYDQTLVKTNTDQTLSYHTVGGDANKGLIGEVQLDKPVEKVNMGEWQSTLRSDNALLIDILNDGSIPIYNLISDPTKKEAVRIYINQYLRDREIRDLGDVPIYSYVSAKYKDHIYSRNNKPFLEDATSYINEGIAFYAFPTQVSGTVPVYSYNSPRNTDHIYSRNNKPFLENATSYRNEGIAFYAYPDAIADTTIPVHSYVSNLWLDHISSINLKPFLEDDPSYVYEGIAFYVPK